MRKEIKSKSKRKWIVGGGLFFGGIALLTTGFATWIVGTQIKDQQAETTVTIDTVEDQTLILTAKATDAKLDIVEPVKSTGLITVKDNTPDDGVAQATDFSITLEITIEKGKTVTKPTKLSIVINDQFKDDNKNVLTAANLSAAKLDTASTYTNHLAETDYSYLVLTTEIILEDAGWNDDETTYSKEHTFDLLDWGTYFGEDLPSKYYDACGAAKGIKIEEPTTYRAFMAEVKSELDAFTSAIKGDGIKDTVLPLKISIA